MNKIIIFSHESDIDGMGSIILGKLAFKNIAYQLLPNPESLELTFRKLLTEQKLLSYNQIYITDLALRNPSLEMVANSSLKDKVLIFDHHQRSIDEKLNIYPFTQIIEEDQNGKKCGTELFYEYLIQHNLITNTPIIKDFVELTRLEDTWEWQNKGKFGIMAHDLAIYFNIVGPEAYISNITTKLKDSKERFTFTFEEQNQINEKKAQTLKVLNDLLKEIVYFKDEFNNKFGIVYAKYEYRNDLPEYIRTINNPENIKYLIIVALDKGENGQKSYRTITDGFDVNHIAKNHGGGGHKSAAAVNITLNQKSESQKLSKEESLKYLAECKYT